MEKQSGGKSLAMVYMYHTSFPKGTYTKCLYRHSYILISWCSPIHLHSKLYQSIKKIKKGGCANVSDILNWVLFVFKIRMLEWRSKAKNDHVHSKILHGVSHFGKSMTEVNIKIHLKPFTFYVKKIIHTDYGFIERTIDNASSTWTCLITVFSCKDFVSCFALETLVANLCIHPWGISIRNGSLYTGVRDDYISL